MPLKERNCAISTCQTKASKGMHSFPIDPTQRAIWQNLCQIENVTKSTLICQIHFKESDYEQQPHSDSKLKLLKRKVIPSKFLPENLNIEVNLACDLDIGKSCTVNDTSDSENSDSELIISNENGHNYTSKKHNELWVKYNELLIKYEKL